MRDGEISEEREQQRVKKSGRAMAKRIIEYCAIVSHGRQIACVRNPVGEAKTQRAMPTVSDCRP